MKMATFFPNQNGIQKDAPYLLEFRQLKEYFNFQRRFRSDKKDKNKQNKWINNEYYLIDKNWLNKWKDFVNYNFFDLMKINCDINDNDYNNFIQNLSLNKKGPFLPPLDNSNIYMSNEEINPIAEFIVIDKKCQEVFMEARKNMTYSIKEKSVPVKFLSDKILFNIGNNIKIVCFKNNPKKRNEEIIIIFYEQKNKEKILSDIEKENFILWLRSRNFELDYPDELEIVEQECKIKIINRNLKLKNGIFKNVFMRNKFALVNNLLDIKFNLTDELNTLIQSQIEENLTEVHIGLQPNPQKIKNIDNNKNENQIITKAIKNLDNNLYSKINPKEIDSSKNNPFVNGINYPHPTGLMNTGQSFYMNAIIECLSNIRGLSNNLLKKYGSFNITKQPLIASYTNILYSLFHSKNNSINPKLFYEICEKLNPIFEKKNEKEVEAKDYILFMINIMHKELLPLSDDTVDSGISLLKKEINSFDEKIMLEDCIKKYSSKRTIISDIFYGINRFVVTCNDCNLRRYSFQIFDILIFSLKKVKDYKIKSSKSLKYLDLNLYDAFLSEQEIQKLEGEDGIYCNRCKKMTIGLHKNDIYGLPQILIIVLDRGKNNNNEFNEEFWFDEILDFSDKNIIINKDSYKKFYLSGIITYIEKNKNEGNYIAFSRNNKDDNFLCYNDTKVNPVSAIEAMTTKNPYILLYHFMK